jgi:hypothetical protein
VLQIDGRGMIRIRGTWSRGTQYLRGDVVAQGPRAYSAIVEHVSGDQSQPVFGARCAEFWGSADTTLSPAPVQPVSHQVIQFPMALNAQSAPASAPAASPRMPVGAAPSLPSAASDVPDDSDVAMPNVAMALSWLKAMVGQCVRRDWVEEELQRIDEIISRLVHRLEDLGAPNTLVASKPVEVEAWRRKAAVLSATDRTQAEAMRNAMLWEWVRLLRKRDRGETWTAQEATRAAVLDVLDRECEAIDQAASALEFDTPADVAADKHWPRMGASR